MVHIFFLKRKLLQTLLTLLPNKREANRSPLALSRSLSHTLTHTLQSETTVFFLIMLRFGWLAAARERIVCSHQLHSPPLFIYP